MKENNSQDFHQFFRELLSSIKETNRRIDELKWVLRSSICTDEGRNKVIKRIEALVQTRFCLMFSIYDTRLRLVSNLSDESTLSRERAEELFKTNKIYKELKSL